MKNINVEQKPMMYYYLKDYNFKYVSNMIGGFREGEVITIAARSGCGKSTIGRNLLVNFVKQGIKTLLVSTEETNNEIGPKIKHILKGFDIDYFNFKLSFIEDEEFNVEQIEKDIKSSKSKVVIIDYIQQLDGNIKENTKALKKLANKYGIIIFMFSQLNRMAAGRVPDTSMLSKSDNILHDSDQVWLLHNTELKTKVEKWDVLLLDVAKNRKGEIGKTWISFDKNNGIMYDMNPKYWKSTANSYKNYLENKYPTWAKAIVESLNNINIANNVEKPWMVLKNGIIL